MPAPEALPIIARHILRYPQTKIKHPLQTTTKSLYHQTTSAKAVHVSHVRVQSGGAGNVHGYGGINGHSHVSISARIAASKGDRERILKSIERAREKRGVRGEVEGERNGGLEGRIEGEVNVGRVWEEQVYPPVNGWLV